MLSEIETYSPAKINLHLEIGPVRNDGFHNLSSLFQIVSLRDRVRIRSLKNTNSCIIKGNFSCTPEQNLAFKAHRAFCGNLGRNFGVEITIDKNIPEGAGLGGGSSNAGTVLKALNEMHGNPFSKTALAEAAAELGSDIPFFCLTPLAVVTGRGEFIHGLDNPRTLSLVLIIPDFSVATASAYKWLDQYRMQNNNRDSDSWKAAISSGEMEKFYHEPVKDWPFFNSFTPVLCRHHPMISRYLENLYNQGAVYSEVSGSGSAIFGVFDSFQAAEKASEVFRAENSLKQVLIIELLARFPSSILQ